MLACVKLPSRWAAAINRLLHELDMDIGKVAKDGGLSRQHLSDVLNGTTVPTADMLEKIAKGFKVDMVQLLCTEEQARILREHGSDLMRLETEQHAQVRAAEEQAAIIVALQQKLAKLEKTVEAQAAPPFRTATAPDHPPRKRHRRD